MRGSPSSWGGPRPSRGSYGPGRPPRTRQPGGAARLRQQCAGRRARLRRSPAGGRDRAASAAALREALEHLVPTEVAPTVAEGIATSGPTRVAEVLRAVRDTGGRIVNVQEAEIAEALRRSRARASTSSPLPRWPRGLPEPAPGFRCDPAAGIHRLGAHRLRAQGLRHHRRAAQAERPAGGGAAPRQPRLNRQRRKRHPASSGTAPCATSSAPSCSKSKILRTPECRDTSTVTFVSVTKTSSRGSARRNAASTVCPPSQARKRTPRSAKSRAWARRKPSHPRGHRRSSPRPEPAPRRREGRRLPSRW